MSEGRRDVFICHASEDKTEIVRPLVKALDQERISCWYDEAEIMVGESITEKIDQGLSTSRYFLVVLSPAFVKKPFAKTELLSALYRQAATGQVTILPVLVGSAEERRRILAYFPLLEDRRYALWDGNPNNIVRELLPQLRPGSRAVGRVCFVSSEYPPHVAGGLGVHVEKLTAALGAHLNVDVVLPSSPAEGYQPSPPVRLFPLAKAQASYEDPVSWLRFSHLAAQRITRMVRESAPDVIHCHDWVTVLAGIKCRWLLNIPLVFHLHLPNRAPLCSSVENLGLICSDLITVNSEAMYEELMDRRLPLRGVVEVVKNGVDLDLFRPGEEWPQDDGYILYVGRLVEQKGVEYLLRALYYVREKFPDIRLKIAGEGPFRPWLERLSTNLLLSGQVEFLGWRTGQELARLYQRALVVAVPSIYEPFGMTALEALACQRPVVASRIGGLKEIIQNKVTGFLAEPNDDLDLAQWLMTLLSNADLRNRMGEAGRAYVSSEGYTWPRIAQQFVKLYKDLQGKPLDRSIPAGADEFMRQIISVVKEKWPLQASDALLDNLLAWTV